eukprot:14833012-Alexandrium_andersonii.AAC.1
MEAAVSSMSDGSVRLPLLPGSLTSEATEQQEAASSSSAILRAAVVDAGIAEPVLNTIATPSIVSSPKADPSEKGDDNPAPSKKVKLSDVRLERGKKQKGMAEETSIPTFRFMNCELLPTVCRQELFRIASFSKLCPHGHRFALPTIQLRPKTRAPSLFFTIALSFRVFPGIQIPDWVCVQLKAS